ncbi:MAG: ABC-three component system middle component 8 [Bryobacteraceae bacterium]|jgi:hypothetical protein
MLKPTKHLDPESSVLNISAHILKYMERHRTMTYRDLYGHLYNKCGDAIRPLFLPALSFLYLLGKIEYHTKNDSFEYRRGDIR